MQNPMAKSTLSGMLILTVFFTSWLISPARAQTTSADPNHSALNVVQAAPEEQYGGAQPAQSGMMAPGRMMGQEMMGGMMHPGMVSVMPMMGMRGHTMKIMFAIADTDGDGRLSFEEVTTIHRRIFDKVDANKDGKVTPEELQSFMRE
jgi:hypothetical protein